jgi:hypothetical protein
VGFLCVCGWCKWALCVCVDIVYQNVAVTKWSTWIVKWAHKGEGEKMMMISLFVGSFKWGLWYIPT